MFISPAYAQAIGGGSSGWQSFIPLVLIFVVFYFLLIRPQQKKARLHREMLGSIRRGDRVVTGGGIIGTVTKVYDDNEIAVEITDGIKVRVQRGLVASVLSRTEPAQSASKGQASSGTIRTCNRKAVLQLKHLWSLLYYEKDMVSQLIDLNGTCARFPPPCQRFPSTQARFDHARSVQFYTRAHHRGLHRL